MKSVKYLLIALSLSAAVAHAQDSSVQPAASTQTASKSADVPGDRADRRTAQRVDENKKDDCTGPISFCNIYFGS